MKVLDDGRIMCRVRIKGTFRGRPWEYVDPEDDASQFIWPPDQDGNIDPSEYWWAEGNLSCDCNRASFLPGAMRDQMPDGFDCGHEIRIDSIVPIERGPNGEELPSLYLNESSEAP